MTALLQQPEQYHVFLDPEICLRIDGVVQNFMLRLFGPSEGG